MKVLKLGILVNIIVSMISCSSDSNSLNNQDLINHALPIDLNFEEASVCGFSELFKSNKLIVLSDSNKTIIGSFSKVELLDDRIIITDKQTNKIVIYDFNGNIIQIINKKGRGPDEYSAIHETCVNYRNKTIDVYDRNLSKVIKYDFEGNFIKRYVTPKYALNFTTVGDYSYFYRDMLGFINEKGNPTNLHLIISNSDESRVFFKYNYYINSLFNSWHFNKTNEGELLFWMDQENSIYTLNKFSVKMRYKINFKPSPIMTYEKYCNAKSMNDIRNIENNSIGKVGNIDNFRVSKHYIYFSYGKQMKKAEYSLAFCLYDRKKQRVEKNILALNNEVDYLNNLLLPKYINDSIFVSEIPKYKLQSGHIEFLNKKYNVNINSSSNSILVISKLKKI